MTEKKWRSARVKDLENGVRVRAEGTEGNVAYCYCCTLHLYAILFDTRYPPRVYPLGSLEVADR